MSFIAVQSKRAGEGSSLSGGNLPIRGDGCFQLRDGNWRTATVEHPVTVRTNRAQVHDGIDCPDIVHSRKRCQMVNVNATNSDFPVRYAEIESAHETGRSIVFDALRTRFCVS